MAPGGDPIVEMLQRSIDTGFENIHRLLAEQNRQAERERQINSERHGQNTTNIATVDADVKKLTRTVDTMNGTVATHTQVLSAHTKDLDTLFKRPIALTLTNLRWYIAVFLGGVMTVVTALTLLVAVLHALHLLPGQS
jgi:hypothetical protein